MPQQPIEVILTRQLAEYLSFAVFVVDRSGDLVFYNEHAERILGVRFEEAGPMPAERWAHAFAPTDAAGKALSPDQLPLLQALQHRRPALGQMFIRGLDGARREIEVSAFPLIGHGEREIGAVAMFWPVEPPA